MDENEGAHHSKDRHRRYCYALNNWVLNATFFASPQDPPVVMQRAQLLEAASRDPAIWDECKYSDTLARFYLRAAILSGERADFELFLNWADEFCAQSRRASKRTMSLFETLGRDIKRVKRLGFAGARRAAAPQGVAVHRV